MSEGKGCPSVNEEGMAEGFRGIMVWSPASLIFDVEEATRRFGMVGSKMGKMWYARTTQTVTASLAGQVK
jgi:hypothetical protein